MQDGNHIAVEQLPVTRPGWAAQKLGDGHDDLRGRLLVHQCRIRCIARVGHLSATPASTLSRARVP